MKSLVFFASEHQLQSIDRHDSLLIQVLRIRGLADSVASAVQRCARVAAVASWHAVHLLHVHVRLRTVSRCNSHVRRIFLVVSHLHRDGTIVDTLQSYVQHLVLGVAQHVSGQVLLGDRENYILLINFLLLITIFFIWMLDPVGKIDIEVPEEVTKCELERLIQLTHVQLDGLAHEFAKGVLVQFLGWNHILAQEPRLRIRPLQDLRGVLQYLSDNFVVVIARFLEIFALLGHNRIDCILVVIAWRARH